MFWMTVSVLTLLLLVLLAAAWAGWAGLGSVSIPSPSSLLCLSELPELAPVSPPSRASLLAGSWAASAFSCSSFSTPWKRKCQNSVWDLSDHGESHLQLSQDLLLLTGTFSSLLHGLGGGRVMLSLLRTNCGLYLTWILDLASDSVDDILEPDSFLLRERRLGTPRARRRRRRRKERRRRPRRRRPRRRPGCSMTRPSKVSSVVWAGALTARSWWLPAGSWRRRRCNNFSNVFDKHQAGDKFIASATSLLYMNHLSVFCVLSSFQQLQIERISRLLVGNSENWKKNFNQSRSLVRVHNKT